MALARDLLMTARGFYDEPRHGLAAAARDARWSGFAGGAQWMRGAIAAVRGRAPDGDAAFHWLGVLKYGIATVGAVAMVWIAFVLSWWLLPAAVVVFYAIECRMVFAFPLALDGSRRPLRDSHALVSVTMSAACATLLVMRIAAEMLVGGFLGRGFVRSWCVGCMAVVVWYERARATGATGS